MAKKPIEVQLIHEINRIKAEIEAQKKLIKANVRKNVRVDGHRQDLAELRTHLSVLNRNLAKARAQGNIRVP